MSAKNTRNGETFTLKAILNMMEGKGSRHAVHNCNTSMWFSDPQAFFKPTNKMCQNTHTHQYILYH